MDTYEKPTFQPPVMTRPTFTMTGLETSDVTDNILKIAKIVTAAIGGLLILLGVVFLFQTNGDNYNTTHPFVGLGFMTIGVSVFVTTVTLAFLQWMVEILRIA